MPKQWKDMDEEEQAQWMRSRLEQFHQSAQKERKMVRNPQGDDSIIVGCDQYCYFPSKSELDFVVQHDLRNEGHLYFCDNPKAERFSDGTLKLCMVFGSRQADEHVSEVRKGNIRVRGERG